MDKSRVLFLCTGNSCRSQIAEAIVNYRFSEHWQAYSAGSHPAGSVHPLAINALAEIGIDFHGRSKGMDEFIGQSFDLVVTLCDQSEQECPVWLGVGRKLHTPFEDPALVPGSDDDKMLAFRRVRDEILSQMPFMLGNP